MRARTARLPIGIAALLSVLVSAPSRAATLASPPLLDCQSAILKGRRALAVGLVRLEQKCRDANLKHGAGTCPRTSGAVATAMARERARLFAAMERRLADACTFGPGILARLDFPGRCADADGADGFTVDDLTACIRTTTERAVYGACEGGGNDGEACTLVADCPDSGPDTACRSLLATEYDVTIVDHLRRDARSCQTTLAQASLKFLDTALKGAERCRRRLAECRLASALGGASLCDDPTLPPSRCLTHDPPTVVAIARAREKAEAAIMRKCGRDAIVQELAPCEPDQTTAAAAASCETAAHLATADRFLAIDLPEPARCGDGHANRPEEECDRSDDATCPGQCGAFDEAFPCLCREGSQQRRLRVVGSDVDLDLGWTGAAHDFATAPANYLTDLWDCDGPAGPDSECAVGPSCSLPPHGPCAPPAGDPTTGDAICASLGQGTCRTTAAGATGPRCSLTHRQRCATSSQCPIPGEECVVTPSGPPIPLSAAGVSICVVGSFAEDVVGTVDLATGAGAVRVRQDGEIHIGGDVTQPCPVCGGFCAGVASPTGPGLRTLCTSDADCTAGSHCVTEPICSFGPNQDRPCRPHPPGGAGTGLFGTTSVDCGLSPSSVASRHTFVMHPLQTGTTTLTADRPCHTAGVDHSVCAGGPNEHRACAVDSECPGGSCNAQCFCPSGVGERQRPNGCGAACVGGPDEGAPCVDDASCGAPGFCHQADCQADPSDTDSAQEGRCTAGPTPGLCSINSFVTCASDDECRAPACPFCEPGETCSHATSQCFVSPTIVRQGAAGIPERTTTAIFCLAGTGSPIVDTVFGLPGPGAVTQSETLLTAGF